MRVITPRTLKEFVASLAGNADQRAVKSALDAWFAEARKATWTNMAELKQQFGNASAVSAERVVFNIKGNAYRLVVSINFKRQAIFIIWIGSHGQYDEIDVKTVQYGE